MSGSDALPNVPWVDSPLFEAQLAASGADGERTRLARRFHEDGFVVLEEAVPEGLVDAIVDQYPSLFEPSRRPPDRAPKPTMLVHDPKRRQDAWTVSPEVRELACLPAVLDLLRFLYGREPVPFQTLNFLPGTEQSVHSDSIHFDTVPHGFMCGVWVALEDVTEENGPLVYYPGSHRLPRVRLEELGVWAPDGKLADSLQYGRYEAYVRGVLEATALEPRRLTAPKGTALVWSSNLLHGGSPVTRPGATRMSQVTHYFFADCLYYAPILSNAVLGEYRIKPVYDVRTDEPVPPRLNGEPLESLAMPDGRLRFARRGTFSLGWPLGFWRQRAALRAERFCRKRGWNALAGRIASVGYGTDGER